MCDTTTVEVALRIRPLVEDEVSKGCKNILQVFETLNQVRIKSSDKSFTYNHVFDCHTDQEDFYCKCVQPLIPNLFQGLNVTVLAYGQTGSGKTHSMGTNYSGVGQMGVIPRAIQEIFETIEKTPSKVFTLSVSFIELYQETLYDLLSTKSREDSVLDIREDTTGTYLPGIIQAPITSSIAALSMLCKGSLRRATGSTNMNKQSSRSHAIFTLHIVIEDKDNGMAQKTAKFHLVDLAGSERSKKTGATGKTFREGVNINKGLLALGNVISALGDEKYNQGYISYRDSNLTRLLKDSLGGNSLTLMIACVSPADYNLEETLSTLRYADRARKIKNKPIVNEDPKAAEISRLNRVIHDLQLELAGKGASYPWHNSRSSEFEEKYNNAMVMLSTALGEKAILFEKVLTLQTSQETGIQTLNDFKNTLKDHDCDLRHDNALNVVKEFVDKFDSCFNLKNNSISEEIADDSLNNNDLSTEEALRNQQEAYANKQVALNAEIENVIKMINTKEDLAKKIAANAAYMVDNESMIQNEDKIKHLEKEKLELMQQLKSQGDRTTGAKHKQIQELEKKIDDLRKKIAEQAKLLRLKTKDEEKIKHLNNDVLALKQTKVKLVRNMKEETDRFRKFKLSKEKELCKLKAQDRKRQNQLMTMEKLHSRQQNVLRRKVEEAIAVNKRLQNILALRKTAKEHRNNKSGIVKINQWIKDEVELYINVVDAKASIDILIQDRSILQEELNLLQQKEGVDPKQLSEIQSHIDLRSAQIADFQQKVLDHGEDAKNKNPWDEIQNMADAKVSLAYLFDKLSEIKMTSSVIDFKNNDLAQSLADQNKKNSALAEQLKEQELFFKTQINDLERDYEEKINVLLQEIRNVDIENAVQSNDVDKYSVQLDHINHLQEKNNELKETNTLFEEKIKNLKIKLNRNNNRNTSKEIKLKTKVLFANDDSDLEEIDVDVDDDKDPDWRNTPLAKRFKRMRELSLEKAESRKRNATGGCTCKKSCSTKSCGCKKFHNSCSALCKCSISICVNRSLQNSANASHDVDSEDSTSSESFKKLKTITPRSNLFPPL